MSEESESYIIYHYSQVLVRQQHVSTKESRIGTRNGTRVVARDMFGNFPVRTKQRAIHFEVVDNVERALDRLKFRITALALAWPKAVRIIVSNQIQQRRKFTIGLQAKAGGHVHESRIEAQKRSTFRLDHICTLLSGAGYITPTDFDSWTKVSARTSQTFVRAAICLEPAPSKQVQFISLGINPLDCSSSLSQVLYREVNLLFAESAFGTSEDDLDISEEERQRRLNDRRFKLDSHTGRKLRGKGKCANRFPMFYIRINPGNTDVSLDVLRSDEDDSQAAKFIEKTVQLISSMVYQFLQEHQFRPGTRKRPNGLRFPRKRFAANSRASNPLKESSYPSNSAEISDEDFEDHTTTPRNLAHTNVVKKVEAELPQKIHSSTSFSSWSRIKSAKSHALSDLLSGLPRSKLPHGLQRSISEPAHNAEHLNSLATDGMRQESWTAEHLKEKIELLLRDLDEDHDPGVVNQESEFEQRSEITSHRRVSERHGESCTLEPRDSEDGIIIWENPVSGKILRINSRTGLSHPDLPSRPNSEPQGSASILSNPLQFRYRGSLRHSRTEDRPFGVCAEVQSDSGSWLSGLLRSWHNPAFHRKELPIPSISAGHVGELHAEHEKRCHEKNSDSLGSGIASREGRLSKTALRDAIILGQVDKKFILAIMRTSEIDTASKTPANSALVLIDQHAADERCRVEKLYGEISNAKAMHLPKPIIFEVTQQEDELFRRERTHFETWGFVYEVGVNKDATKDTQAFRPASAHLPQAQRLVDQNSNKRPTTASVSRTSAVLTGDGAKGSSLQILVKRLPELIAERCRLDSKMLVDLLRSEVWARTENTTRASTHHTPSERSQEDAEEETAAYSWLKHISDCPRGVIDLLNSRACRSAIMFNDELTKLECEDLIKKLAKCAFPFQCAHGRPSMVVLGEFGSEAMQISTDIGAEVEKRQSTRRISQAERSKNPDFFRAFTAWQQSTLSEPRH